MTKLPKQTNKGIPISGLWGIGLLIVCASIGFSTYLVWMGTDSLAVHLLTIPQAAFVVYYLTLKAAK